MSNRTIYAVAGTTTLLGVAVLASQVTREGTTSTTREPDACAGMPVSPAESGYPVGNCPFWIAPPAKVPGSCRTAIPGFHDTPILGPDGTLAVSCRYSWTGASTGPTRADIGNLPPGAAPDCNYVTPQATADVVLHWARDELRNAVGQRLEATTNDPVVRTIVLDTVPAAPTWPVPVGAQHGQTLAWMLKDLACEDIQRCPLEVQTALAMPRQIDPSTGRPVIHPEGGSFGFLSDVTDALWTSLRTYRNELRAAAQNTSMAKSMPIRLIVASAFGFDNDGQGGVCNDTPQSGTESVRKMYDAYVAASCLGALHVAAAGNSSGGASPQRGMLCPARWDKAIRPNDTICAGLWGAAEWTQIKQDHAAVYATRFPGTSAALITPATEIPTDHLLSVGGVDYHGTPLVLSRPDACAETVAVGLGGIGWVNDEQVPPVLAGTSVSAALAAARLGVRWANEPSLVPTNLVTNVVGQAQRITFARRADCDGGLAISCPNPIAWLGAPSSAVTGQNPPATNKVQEAIDSRTDRIQIEPPGPAVCTSRIPHCVLESRTATTDIWPQPGDPLCLKCIVRVSTTTNPTTSRAPELAIDGNASIPLDGFTGAALIVENQDGVVVLTKPFSPKVFLSPTTIVLTDVPSSIFTNARVWLSVYAPEGRTVSQQIFVTE